MSISTETYHRKPFKGQFNSSTQTLVSLMDSACVQHAHQWSFAGGFARDNYLGREWNDYDICVQNAFEFATMLAENGIIEKGTAQGEEIPHDYYIDPYDFSKRKFPVHWIQADDYNAYAPMNFDFSINQICLKSDGYYYANMQTWHDLNRGIIRRTTDRSTGNIALRAIRFAVKYGFSLHEDLEKEIRKLAREEEIGVNLIQRNLEKMEDDGVEKEAFEMMKEFEIPYIDSITDLELYKNKINGMIARGDGYYEPMGHRYG